MIRLPLLTAVMWPLAFRSLTSTPPVLTTDEVASAMR